MNVGSILSRRLQIGSGLAHLDCWRPQPQLTVVTPHLPNDLPAGERDAAQPKLLMDLLLAEQCDEYALWYTTPMTLDATRDLCPLAVVYDCANASEETGATPEWRRMRALELLRSADLVFASSHQVYQAKRLQHSRVFAFPSSVDAAHFARAQCPQPDPDDQRAIPHPRIGYFGALDARLNAPLLFALANVRPRWSFILIGPVVGIDPGVLPWRPNIHYLGVKPYADLPRYLAGWDIAMLPFAQNPAARVSAPTQPLEYLAGAKPTVSAAIPDVIRRYGDDGPVTIADWPAEWVWAIEDILSSSPTRYAEWLAEADRAVSYSSWASVWQEMRSLLDGAVAQRRAALANGREHA